MATTRPFTYNTGFTISGTIQIGNIAVGVSNQDYSINPGGVKWWMGPDEDLGYIIVNQVPTGDHSTSVNVGSYVNFWRSTDLTNQSFLDLLNVLPITEGLNPFTDADDAKIWLNNNGYWTSYGENLITPTDTPTPTPTETPIPSNTPTPTPTPTPTDTPISSDTPTPTPTPTIVSTDTPTPTPEPTSTPTPTSTSIVSTYYTIEVSQLDLDDATNSGVNNNRIRVRYYDNSDVLNTIYFTVAGTFVNEICVKEGTSVEILYYKNNIPVSMINSSATNTFITCGSSVPTVTPTPNPTDTPTPTPTIESSGVGSWYFYSDAAGEFDAGPPISDGNAIFTINNGSPNETFNPNKVDGVTYLYFNIKDSTGTDYTSQFSGYTGGTGTITISQNGDTATYTSTTLGSFQIQTIGDGSFFIISTVPCTQTKTSNAPFVFGDAISLSFS
jgi:hypothetical protein